MTRSTLRDRFTVEICHWWLVAGKWFQGGGSGLVENLGVPFWTNLSTAANDLWKRGDCTDWSLAIGVRELCYIMNWAGQIYNYGDSLPLKDHL